MIRIKILSQIIQIMLTRDITTIGLQDLRARLTIIPQVNTIAIVLSVLDDDSTRTKTKYFVKDYINDQLTMSIIPLFFRSRPCFLAASVSTLTLATTSLTRLCTRLFTALD